MSSFSNTNTNTNANTNYPNLQPFQLPPSPMNPLSASNPLSNGDDGSIGDFNFRFDKEQLKLEMEITRLIRSGKSYLLNPNSLQGVAIGQHRVCVCFQDNYESGYRIWEWHGHMLIYKEGYGHSYEYFHGHTYDRFCDLPPSAPVSRGDEEKDRRFLGKEGTQGLRELLAGKDPSGGRFLHREVTAHSPRYYKIPLEKLKINVGALGNSSLDKP